MSTVETFNEKLPRERSNQVVIISNPTVWFVQKKRALSRPTFKTYFDSQLNNFPFEQINPEARRKRLVLKS